MALSISLISLLITGLDVSATAQLAYARAFSMTPLRGLQKYLRGAGWLVLLLVGEFVFFLISPRLLLELPFKWRDLAPGAAVCTVAALIVHVFRSGGREIASGLPRDWVGHRRGAQPQVLCNLRSVFRTLRSTDSD